MKIAHTGDLHLDERDERFDDMVHVLRKMFSQMADEADVILVAGDLVGRESAHHYTVRERLALASLLIDAADTVPVVVIRGNHDRHDELAIFNKLESYNQIYAVDFPNKADILAPPMVFARAFLQKRDLLKSIGLMGVEEANRSASSLLASACRSVRPDSDFPYVGLFHLPVAGVCVGAYEVQTTQDVALGVEDLDSLDYDYIALGHIHQTQQVSEKAWYCGSPYPLTLGENHPKGFLLVEVEKGLRPQVELRTVQSWSIGKLELKHGDIGSFEPSGHEGEHVRVRVGLPHGVRLSENEISSITVRLKQCGALSVRIQQDAECSSEARQGSEAVVKARSDSTALRELLSGEGLPEEDIERLVGRFEELGQCGTTS